MKSFSYRHTCCVEGVGTIRIRLYDGTMRELKDVRYVPSMSKNLISVGALEVERLLEKIFLRCLVAR